MAMGGTLMFARVAAVVAASTTAIGWAVVADQLAADGWTKGGGTTWLTVLACVATAGVVLAVPALLAGRHLAAAICLLLVVASPTVFAGYPLNAAVLVFEFIEAGAAWSAHARHPSSGNW